MAPTWKTKKGKITKLVDAGGYNRNKREIESERERERERERRGGEEKH